MRIARYLAVLAVVFLGTTAKAEVPFTNSLWLMQPVATPAAEGEPETRTARIGEFLFDQDIAAAAEAVLSSRVELEVLPALRWSQSPATLVLEPGDALVRVTGAGARAVFCDRRISWQSRSWLDGRRLRACLVDETRDGVFDRVMWAPAAEALFTPMFLLGVSDHTVDAAYAVRVADNPRLITAGPIVTRSAFGAYRATFAVAYNGAPQALDDLSHSGGEARPDSSSAVLDASGLFFRAEDTPLTVEVVGARIEILAVDRETVTYRVLSTFDATTPMQIGYHGSMGVQAP